MQKITECLVEEHKGEIAFEYIIVLVLFAMVIFAVASSPLMDRIMEVVDRITNYITNNNNPSNHFRLF